MLMIVPGGDGTTGTVKSARLLSSLKLYQHTES